MPRRRVRGGVPDAVADAIVRALAPDARDRPTSADVARALAAVPTTAGA